jgi:hypothetical protein
MEGVLVVYQFSRSKVERGDFSDFLGRYGFDKLPTGRRLRTMMNSLVFCMEGYDHDGREIHMIPEIRQFYQQFNHAWPYWFYFCNLDVDSLKAMTFCCLERVTTMQVDGQQQVAVNPNPVDFAGFLSHNFGGMNQVCERAHMFESLIHQRTSQLLKYYGIPESPSQPAP